jgi:AcrR family transcriptional regulator
LARQRTKQILRAMAGVVARDGLAGTTIANVAAAAGLKRTLILHYFGSRDGLMESFITEVVAVYGEQMFSAADDLPVTARVDRLFEPGAYRTQNDLVIWVELVARSARDPVVRQRLHDLWTERWFPEITRLLQTAYPHAGTEDVNRVAYGLASLVEAHWYFHLQGLGGGDHRRYAQQSAHALLETLNP